MVKAKSKATVMVAGVDGMTPVVDRRFQYDWPLNFEIPSEQADTWLRYLDAECTRRGWNSSGIRQLEAQVNSGSMTLNTGGSTEPKLAIVWERKRGGPLMVHARSEENPEFPPSQIDEFFGAVNAACEAGATELRYCRGQLEYEEGLPWCGELWLDEKVRLGPPTRQYDGALLGPRIIVVDAMVECIGARDALHVFEQLIRELSLFLTAVLDKLVRVPRQGQQVWSYTTLDDCAVRKLGYFDGAVRQEMPVRGACRPIPLKPVRRPDFSLRGVDFSAAELTLPADVIDLWTDFVALPLERRRRFQQSAAKWQEAKAIRQWGDRSTLSFVLMVVACEALKPANRQFRDHTAYHVVESLLGKAVAEKLRTEFPAEAVRGTHLHLGQFHNSEFLLWTMTSSYQDPTFGQVHERLAMITQAAIIEWLKRQGVFTLPSLTRRASWRRRVRRNALLILPVVLTAGLVLGWLARGFWGLG